MHHRLSGKQKNKRADVNEDCILITPLSIEVCLSKIEAMTYYDLKVDIKYHSRYKAEVYLEQRRDYDHPIYITSQLIATERGTCVTFDGGKPSKSGFQGYGDRFAKWLMRLILGIAWLPATYLIIEDPASVRPLMILFLVCLFLFSYDIHSLRKSRFPTSKSVDFKTDVMTESMLRRANELKSNLYNALYAKQSEARFDELGNMYYIDADESQQLGEE